MHTISDPSFFLDWSFALLPMLVGGTVVWAIWRTSGRRAGIRAVATLTLWLAFTGGLADSGFLDQWTPPRMLLLFGSILIFLFWSARQPWTQRLGDLSLKWLVGFQSFRIVVEVLLHQAVREGVAHPTMTRTGTNFDILPGISALLLCPFADRVKSRNLQIWNVAMAVVLTFTVVTAILSGPTPFRLIGGDPPNVFVARWPFVWLPRGTGGFSLAGTHRALSQTSAESRGVISQSNNKHIKEKYDPTFLDALADHVRAT